MASVVNPFHVSGFPQVRDERRYYPKRNAKLSIGCLDHTGTSLTESQGVHRIVLRSHPPFDIDASKKLRVAAFDLPVMTMRTINGRLRHVTLKGLEIGDAGRSSVAFSLAPIWRWLAQRLAHAKNHRSAELGERQRRLARRIIFNGRVAIADKAIHFCQNDRHRIEGQSDCSRQRASRCQLRSRRKISGSPESLAF